MAADSQVVVVVPTFNERQNVDPLISRLLAVTGYRIIIVDDDSPDGTAVAVREWMTCAPERVHLIERRPPRSFAGSYEAGMTHALRAGAQLICQMDADLSHNPEQLPSLVAAAGAADVAVGSRYVAGGRTEGWPLRRRALSAAANAYVRWVTGLPVADATSGFKCWRREALGFALTRPLTANGYALQFEMLYRAWTAGSRLVEVPISFVDRTAGRSKMSASNIVEAARAPFRIVAAERRARHNRQPHDRSTVRTDSTAQPRVTPTQQ